MNQLSFTFDKNQIHFSRENGELMVNATEMAKPFGKKVNHFLENQSTKDFIGAAIKNRNSGFISLEKETDLVISIQKSGTWMHRILALKFAAWLDAEFELWVYSTIDDILFGHYIKLENSLKESAQRQSKMEELKETLRENEAYLELEELQARERREAYRRGKENRSQLELFKA